MRSFIVGWTSRAGENTILSVTLRKDNQSVFGLFLGVLNRVSSSSKFLPSTCRFQSPPHYWKLSWNWVSRYGSSPSHYPLLAHPSLLSPSLLSNIWYTYNHTLSNVSTRHVSLLAPHLYHNRSHRSPLPSRWVSSPWRPWRQRFHYPRSILRLARNYAGKDSSSGWWQPMALSCRHRVVSIRTDWLHSVVERYSAPTYQNPDSIRAWGPCFSDNVGPCGCKCRNEKLSLRHCMTLWVHREQSGLEGVVVFPPLDLWLPHHRNEWSVNPSKMDYSL